MALYKLSCRYLSASESKKMIDAARKVVIDRCNPQFLYLFGSAARGELREGSDIDLIAVLKDHDALKAARKSFYSDRHGLGFPLDLIFCTHAEFDRLSKIGGVFLVAKEDGKCIYEGMNG